MNAYQRAVEHGLRGLGAPSTGVAPGCDVCREEHKDYVPTEDLDTGRWTVPVLDSMDFATEEEATDAARESFDEDVRGCSVYSEPGFSKCACGICGTHLAGNREVWHFILDGRMHHDDDACSDCVAYLANGDIPEGWEE